MPMPVPVPVPTVKPTVSQLAVQAPYQNQRPIREPKRSSRKPLKPEPTRPPKENAAISVPTICKEKPALRLRTTAPSAAKPDSAIKHSANASHMSSVTLLRPS
jgi:hypothetical protein